MVREAFGTRARDTDWMDGFYPYHEMNTYMGLIAIVLAVVGAGGAASRDRWTGFWVLLIGIGCVLMLGRYTLLFDYAHRLPILGSSREPVRFHVWVSLGVAALAATGVERLGRPGPVSLRARARFGRPARGDLDSDHDLQLCTGLDRAAAMVGTVPPSALSMAGPRAPDRALRTALLSLVAWWIARGAARLVGSGPPVAAGRGPAAFGSGRPLHRALV